jgi:phosphatidylinositol alpha-1,6-mannosyltransferase
MNLAIVAPDFPPSVGGMQTHALQVARHLARTHQVTVIAPPAPGAADVDASLAVRRSLRRQYWTSVLELRRLLARLAPDAVLALNAGYGMLGRVTPYPVVTRVVGNDFTRSWIGPHLPLRVLFWRLPIADPRALGPRLRRADQRYRNRWVLWGLRGSRRILCNSAYTRDALAEGGVTGPRVQVLIGGVDVATFSPRPRGKARARLGLPEAPILCTAAALRPKKGIDTTLRALPSLVGRYPHLLYLVLGTGGDEAALRALARELRVEAHVRFAGVRGHDQLPDFLAASDIYLQPSRAAVDPVTGCADVETMGRAVGEASACGVAVIASRSGGLPDMVRDGETGLLVPEDDPPALGAAIDRLLADAALRERFGRAGVDVARREFSWERVGEETERALREVSGAR